MKKNVGGADRWLRIGAAAAIAGLYFTNRLPKNKWSKMALAAAGSALTSGVVGYCPVNQALGLNTRKETKLGRLMHNL